MSAPISNVRPPFDPEIVAIVDYALDYRIASDEALTTARAGLIDTLGCGLEAPALRAGVAQRRLHRAHHVGDDLRRVRRLEGLRLSLDSRHLEKILDQCGSLDILVNCADEVPPVRLYGFLANETSLLSE